MLSVACVLAVNFEVYTLSNSDTVCDECCVLTCTSDTHLRRLFVVISVMNSQDVSFQIASKFIVDLPQSALECGFNAQVRARDFDYFSTDFVRSVFVVYAHDSI